MNFPTSKLVADLLVCHPEYRPARIQKIQDFYEGGEEFEKRKGKYLMARQLDKSSAYKDARAACAKYTPEMGDKVNDLVGCILRDPPRIVCNNPDDPRAAFWSNLNKNIDGLGHSLAWLVQSRLVQVMLHDRAYIQEDWPAIEASESGMLAADKVAPVGSKRARLDICFCAKDAIAIEDWDCDDDGELTMVRSHSFAFVRSVADGPIDTERHVWSFITAEVSCKYTADRPSNPKNGIVGWKEGQTAARTELVEHGLGYMPLSRLPAPDGLSVGCRLIDTYDALFNAEAAKAFAEYASALNLPWVKGTSNPKKVELSELGFLFLGENGEFGWSAPPAQVFAALKEACADLRARADAGIRALGDKALQTHQSGVAVGLTKGPKEVFLMAFRDIVQEGLQARIDRAAEARKETDLEPRLVGMDQLGEQAAQLEVTVCQLLLALPITKVAKRNLIRQLVATNCDLSEAELEEFEKELALLDEELDVAPPAPAGGGITDKKGAPSGLGVEALSKKRSVSAPNPAK